MSISAFVKPATAAILLLSAIAPASAQETFQVCASVRGVLLYGYGKNGTIVSKGWFYPKARECYSLPRGDMPAVFVHFFHGSLENLRTKKDRELCADRRSSFELTNQQGCRAPAEPMWFEEVRIGAGQDRLTIPAKAPKVGPRPTVEEMHLVAFKRYLLDEKQSDFALRTIDVTNQGVFEPRRIVNVPASWQPLLSTEDVAFFIKEGSSGFPEDLQQSLEEALNVGDDDIDVQVIPAARIKEFEALARTAREGDIVSFQRVDRFRDELIQSARKTKLPLPE